MSFADREGLLTSRDYYVIMLELLAGRHFWALAQLLRLRPHPAEQKPETSPRCASGSVLWRSSAADTLYIPDQHGGKPCPEGSRRDAGREAIRQ